MSTDLKERTYIVGSGEPRKAFAFFDDTDTQIDFIRLVHDGSGEGHKSKLVLEGYFNDLYKLFIRKLGQFECGSEIVDADVEKLKNLLDEVVKVKKMLVGGESKRLL